MFTQSRQNQILALVIAMFWEIYIITRPNITMPILFGDKTVATFDLWSGQHLLTGMILGAVLRNRSRQPFLVVIIIAYGWEVVEWSMESGWWGSAVAHWKHGHEHWSNRLFSDPLMAMVGAKLSLRFRVLIWVAIPVTIIWCVANILAPDCMAIQRSFLAFITT